MSAEGGSVHPPWSQEVDPWDSSKVDARAACPSPPVTRQSTCKHNPPLLTLDSLAPDEFSVIVEQLAHHAASLDSLSRTNKALRALTPVFDDSADDLGDHDTNPKKKQKKNERAPLLELLESNADVIDVIVAHLGLHAVNLRQTCTQFSRLDLSPGAAVALAGLQIGPSIPCSMHCLRRTTAACTYTKWDYFSYCANQQWRMEWAHYRKTVECAPIAHLIDAFESLPKLPKHDNFFGKVWLGNPTENKLFNPKQCSDDDDDDDACDGIVHNRRTTSLKASQYKEHLRLALFKVIEERLWYVCLGKDLGEPMNPDDIVPTVKRILNVVKVDNDRCFHFTSKGWLKYTPFLLAAEYQNLQLVRYLARRSDTILSACSAGGNNAYAICKNAMRRSLCSATQIEQSPLLAFLKDECGLSAWPYIAEGR